MKVELKSLLDGSELRSLLVRPQLNLQQALEIIKCYQARNYAAYCPHRKCTLQNIQAAQQKAEMIQVSLY
jgi:hypothetical protein